MPVILELRRETDQIAFHRERWAALSHDPGLSQMVGRIETNSLGEILMSPPASGKQGRRHAEIDYLLKYDLGGVTIVESPIITCDGVRVADLGWFSRERFADVAEDDVFSLAPEICLEVLSPDNTRREMDHKKALYFDAGAMEVWFCGRNGQMQFFAREDAETALPHSRLGPEFPVQV